LAFRLRHAAAAIGAFVVVLTFAVLPTVPANAKSNDFADTALIVSVDISNSIDAENYRLQMEGIAAALEDPEVVSAIVGGPNGAILFSLVTWSSGVEISLPLTRISSKEEAAQIAERVRNIPRNWNGGEFTCVSKMFDTIGQSIVPVARDRALRTVIDVSGDGPENCSNDAAVETARDGLVAQGAVINGLPILQAGDEGDDVTVAGWRVNAGRAALEGLELQAWYKSKVIGGPGSFIIAANGFHDFARAIRRKFVMEMSADWPSSLTASVPAPAKGPPTKLR
jgi:hypothetical protein